jgi:flagellar biosynthesis component FlhA
LVDGRGAPHFSKLSLCLLIVYLRFSINKEKGKTKNEKRKTKNEKRKTKNEKRKTKNEKRKTKNEKENESKSEYYYAK